MEFTGNGVVSSLALPTGQTSLIRFARAALALPAFLLLAVTALAQSDISSNPPVPSPATGVSAGATLGGIESVNTANGNVTLTFPLAQLPRDNVSLGAGVSLVYNSAVYDAPAIPQSTSQADLTYTASAHGGGWNYGYEYKLWAQQRIPLVNMSSTVCGLLSSAEKTYWYKNFLQTPDGTNHILYRVFAIPPAGGPTDDPTGTGFLSMDFAGFGNPNTSSSLNCNVTELQYTGVLVFATVDGSDIRVEATTHPGGSGSWIAFLPNGTEVAGPILTSLDNGSYHAEDSPSETITDRNGNEVFIYGGCPTGSACQETINDTPGRLIHVNFVSSGSMSNSWTDTISWNGPNSTTNAVSATVNSTLTPMSGIAYQCGSTTSGFDGVYCNLNTSLWHVTSIQMPSPCSNPTVSGCSNDNQTTYAMNYAPAAGNQNWGELHTLQKCAGLGLTTCSSPQWTVNYNYTFDPATPIRPPGVTINPIASRILSYTENLAPVTTTALQETTTYSIWYPPSSVYTLLGGVSISPPNTVKNPDNGTTTLYLSSLCATNTISRDTCAPLIYKTSNPDGSVTELSYGWWTANPAPPGGLPSGTLLNPFIAITAETRPNGPARAGISGPDVNGNITSSTRYDWGTTITRNANGLVTNVSGTALQNTVMTYNEQSTTAVYWNPSTQVQPGSQSQPNLRAIASLTVNGPIASGPNANSLSATYTYDNATTTANLLGLQLGGGISQSWTYNSNGNMTTQTDPNGTMTASCYNDSYSLYPSAIVVAASSSTCPNPAERTEGRTSTYSTDFFSGVTLTASDADNNITAQYAYDNLDRPLTANQSGTGLSRSATTTYDDVALEISTSQSDTATSLTGETYYDALGRVRLSVDGAGNRIASAYRYRSGNRFQLLSKPYPTGGTPPAWTLTTFDTVGRVTELDHYMGSTPPAPWGSNTTKTGTVTFAYDLTLSGCSGSATSTTDEAGNTKYTCSDGLNRLTAVTEPNATTGAAGTVTTYAYDNLSNLASVDVAGQAALSCGHMRCFTYNNLSRLVSASNPESGTTTYTYDNNGNPLTRTDANGTKMTVAKYDGLNRPIGATAGASAISYVVGGQTAGTSSVTYTYDQGSNGLPGFKGALTSVSNTASTTSYGYDGFGRISASAQITGTYPAFNFAYAYSLTDTLTSITYPSGRQVNYALNAGEQVTAVSLTGGGNYASGIGYTADGGLSTMTLGSTGNTITQTYFWNDRFQPIGMTAAQGGGTLLQLNFYPCPSNGTSCASGSATGNNGNLLSQTIALSGLSLTQTYTYDHLNRLTGAQETGGGTNWSQSYSYDTVGNRWVPASSGLPALSLETPVAQSWYSTSVPNQIASWGYDKNGNVLQIANMARSFSYDGENRQVTATIGSGTSTYSYDGNGQRVSKTVGGQTTTYVYDAFGNLAAEYGGGPISACAGTCYVTTDHLGSTRLLTNSAGQIGGRYDYEPFGQEIGAGFDGRTTAMGFQTTPDAANPKYTGQMRDQETTLDWFNVRHMSGAQGRFQSPDPANAGADPSNPQSWNGYAYVGNNPLGYTDPSGMITEGASSGSGDDPFGAIVAGLIDLGELLGDLFGFGGGPSTIPSVLAMPSSAILQPSPDFDSQGWNEQAPDDGSIDGGTLFGSGNTDPFTFSFTSKFGVQLEDPADAKAWEQISFFCKYYSIGCSPAEIAIKTQHPRGLVFRGEMPIGPPGTAVYRALSPVGESIYVGITRRLAARATEHSGRFLIRGIEGLKGLSWEDARGVEQALIEHYKLGKNGGTLLNKINSIARTNPSYAKQLQRGIAILKSIGFPGF